MMMDNEGPATTLTIKLMAEGARRCGSCSLCCKLLPMEELHKPAGAPCPHQRHGKGCAIYAHRPNPCRLWSCRWLTNDDTADLRRPDRSRYVVDPIPDFVTHVVDATGAETRIPVVQVWVDPKAPDAWRDPALLAFLDRRGRQDGMAALIRLSNVDGFTVFPPSMCADGQWHEIHSGAMEREHTAEEKFAAVATARRVIMG
jgi:hypothetical protein